MNSLAKGGIRNDTTYFIKEIYKNSKGQSMAPSEERSRNSLETMLDKITNVFEILEKTKKIGRDATSSEIGEIPTLSGVVKGCRER